VNLSFVKVYDLVIAGISFGSNYRAQFSRLIRESSYEGLVHRIAEKLPDKKDWSSAASSFFRDETVNKRPHLVVAQLAFAFDLNQLSAFQPELVGFPEQLQYLLELESRTGADNLDDDAFALDDFLIQVAHGRRLLLI
jgi:hypothetical protein